MERRRSELDRRRRFGRKGRRLGQAAVFSVVRGIAYAVGLAIGGWIVYWVTQSF